MAETALSTFLSPEDIALGEIQFTKDFLGSIRAFVRDVEAMEQTIFKPWGKQVTKFVDNAEDRLDDFAFQFSHQPTVEEVFKSLGLPVKKGQKYGAEQTKFLEKPAKRISPKSSLGRIQQPR